MPEKTHSGKCFARLKKSNNFLETIGAKREFTLAERNGVSEAFQGNEKKVEYFEGKSR